MGAPMARHLANAGHDVRVNNRSESKMRELASVAQVTICSSPAEAASGADIIMVCVGNDDDVRDVVFGGQGVVHGLARGSVLVDHTTTSANLARELSQRLGALGVEFVDAPVSGGQAGAENGTLTVMCGSDNPAAFDRVAPVIDSYARSCILLGQAGSGQLAKMVNQICIAGVLEGLAEGLNFAMAAGLDAHAVVDVISKGAAQSWQMENRGHTMIEGKFDFGFAVEWMKKDLSYALAEAARLGAPAPLASDVLRYYEELIGDGESRSDTSSLIRRYRR
jgi:3-hydroxyisobutyrate dehydrogenase-like beta-hydroxyacid dehydrogenase